LGLKGSKKEFKDFSIDPKFFDTPRGENVKLLVEGEK